MPYDLLVEYKIEVEEKFREILRPNEAIRGEPCKLTIYISNLGKEKFPGGTLKDAKVEYGLKGFSRSFTDFFPEAARLKCPEINPDETKEFLLGEVKPLDEGLARIIIKLEAENKQPVKYYQTKKQAMEEDKWYDFFYVISREQILEILLLKQLLEGKHGY